MNPTAHAPDKRYSDGLLAGVANAALALAAASLVLLALVQLWQVFARYALNDSPSWTEPVAILCMNTAMMLGAAAGVHAQRHFSFYMGVAAAPPGLRRALVAFSRLVQLGVGLLLAVWGSHLAIDSWDVPLAGIAIPQGINYLPLSVGGLLIAAFAADLLRRGPDLPLEGR
jgi:TRAP-type C4-dicarboxylate transport system permease small subunit